MCTCTHMHVHIHTMSVFMQVDLGTLQYSLTGLPVVFLIFDVLLQFLKYLRETGGQTGIKTLLFVL